MKITISITMIGIGDHWISIGYRW